LLWIIVVYNHIRSGPLVNDRAKHLLAITS